MVLVTFCLTATLFSIIPVGSQGVREYDAWYDINDDGKIDLKDYYGVGLTYGTEGNSTRNVNVTNWRMSSETVTVWFETLIPSGSNLTSSFYNRNGFSILHFFVGVSGLIGGAGVPVQVRGRLWNSNHTNARAMRAFSTMPSSGVPSDAFTISIPCEEFAFNIVNIKAYDIWVWV